MTRINSWPKISVVIFTYNDVLGVIQALNSVRKQFYPKNKIEIIAIDNDSKDESARIARKYTTKVWIDETRDGPLMRANGMRKATGEYVYMVLEQDMEFKSKYLLKKLVKPLIEDKLLVASFTREYPRKDQSWVTRFISYDPVQRDPLFEFLSPSIESTIIERKKGYQVCKYLKGKIPPTTHMLFRVEYLKKTKVWTQKKDFDHDTIISLINKGFNRFAYVEAAGVYHHHAKNLSQLVSKRIRNLRSHYFPYNENLQYKWLDTSSKFQVLRMLGFVVYANLLFPAFLRGIIRFVKFKDPVLLMEPVITVVVTDAIIWEFVKNSAGRKIIINSFNSFFGKQ